MATLHSRLPTSNHYILRPQEPDVFQDSPEIEPTHDLVKDYINLGKTTLLSPFTNDWPLLMKISTSIGVAALFGEIQKSLYDRCGHSLK